MKRLVMAFSGPSNSGKTTLIEKLVKHFKSKGFKVVVLKHDPSDKAVFDKEGKDSFKFFHAGADTMVLSPTRLSSFARGEFEVADCLKFAEDFDFFFIEGLKELPYPRISVFAKELDESYFAFSNAIASYEKPKNSSLAWLHLDDIEAIGEYIEKHAFHYKKD